MNRFVVAAGAAVLTLAGCASTPAEDTPTPEEAAFVAALEGELSARYAEENLVTVGRQVCNALDAGATVEQVLYTIHDAGLPRPDTAAIVNRAIQNLCPEHHPLAGGTR